MQSIIEHGYAFGEAVSVSLIVELLKKTRTRESVSVDMSDASSAKKESIGMN